MKQFEAINKGYNNVFKPDQLSLGVVVPIEHYSQSSVLTMKHHVKRVQVSEQLGFKATNSRNRGKPCCYQSSFQFKKHRNSKIIKGTVKYTPKIDAPTVFLCAAPCSPCLRVGKTNQSRPAKTGCIYQ